MSKNSAADKVEKSKKYDISRIIFKIQLHNKKKIKTSLVEPAD